MLTVVHEQLVDDWLAAQRSEETRRAYRVAAEQWRGWLASRKVTLGDATRADVEQWVRWLAGAGGHKPSTVKARLNAIRSLYRYMVEVDAIPRSPATHVRSPQADDELVLPSLSLEQMRSLCTAAAQLGPTEYALIRLLCDNGLRIGETIRADVEHLSEDGGRRILLLPHRKGGKRGQAVLADITAGAIDHMLDGRTRGPLFVRAGMPTRTSVQLEAARITRNVAAGVIQRACRRAGVPVVPPHGLRRSFATVALDADANLVDVQDAMGHRSPSTTRKYDQARNRLERSPSLAVAAALAGPAGVLAILVWRTVR